jgi:hypothetical protein
VYRQFFPSSLIVFITCIDRFFPRPYAFNSLSLVLYRLLRLTLYLVSEIVYFRFEIVYSRSEIVYSRSEIVILVLKSFILVLKSFIIVLITTCMYSFCNMFITCTVFSEILFRYVQNC